MSDIKEELAKRALSLRKKESGKELERKEAVDGADHQWKGLEPTFI